MCYDVGMIDFRNPDGTVNPVLLAQARAELASLPAAERARELHRIEQIQVSQYAPRSRFTVDQRGAAGATLDVFGPIGESWFAEGFTARQVARVLKDTAGPITLRINSPGGDAFEGAAIYNLLTAAPNRVDIEILALAASAASVVAMAASDGGEIRMAETGVLMIHDATTGAYGGVADMESAAQLLRGVNAQMADVYARRSGRAAADMSALMTKETWLTAKEAVEMGLATRVVSGGRATLAAPTDLSRAPAEIRALLAIPHRATGTPMQDLAKRLGLPENASEAEIMAALDKALTPATPPVVPAQVTSAPPVASRETVVTPASVIAAGAVLQLHDAAVCTAVERFISAGLITPAQRALATQACGASPESLRAAVQYWESCQSVVPPALIPAQHARDDKGRFASEAGTVTPSTMSKLQKQMCKDAGIKPEDFCERKNAAAEQRAGSN